MIFKGDKFAEKIEQKLRERIEQKKLEPSLLIYLSEENKTGEDYVKQKKKVAKRVGVKVKVQKPDSVEELKKAIKASDEFDGVMVQLPWPDLKGEELKEVLSLIPLEKDVDGLNPENLELIKKGRARFVPATVRAVERVLDKALLETEKEMGKEFKIAIVGAEGMVGKPLVARFKYFGFKVGEFEEGDEVSKVAEYSVVISCTGQAGLLGEDEVGEEFIGIDVGYPKGDFKFEQVERKAAFITPVPGGVGPVTVVSLLANLVEAAAG